MAITWRNVDFGGGNHSMNQIAAATTPLTLLNDSISKGLTSLSNTLDKYKEGQINANNEAYQNTLAQYKTPEEFEAAMKAGIFDAAMQEHGPWLDGKVARDSVGDYLSKLQQGDRERYAFQEAKDKQSAAPIIENMRRLAYDGKYDAASQLAKDNPNLPLSTALGEILTMKSNQASAEFTNTQNARTRKQWAQEDATNAAKSYIAAAENKAFAEKERYTRIRDNMAGDQQMSVFFDSNGNPMTTEAIQSNPLYSVAWSLMPEDKKAMFNEISGMKLGRLDGSDYHSAFAQSLIDNPAIPANVAQNYALTGGDGLMGNYVKEIAAKNAETQKQRQEDNITFFGPENVGEYRQQIIEKIPALLKFEGLRPEAIEWIGDITSKPFKLSNGIELDKIPMAFVEAALMQEADSWSWITGKGDFTRNLRAILEDPKNLQMLEEKTKFRAESRKLSGTYSPMKSINVGGSTPEAAEAAFYKNLKEARNKPTPVPTHARNYPIHEY